MPNFHYTLPDLPNIATLVDLLTYRGQQQPYQTAYTYLENGEIETASVTYQLLDQRARAIASQLQSLELTGERALLLYPAGLEFISALFGCLYAGVIAVPAYPPRANQSINRLSSIILDCQGKIILTIASLIDSIKNRLSENIDLINTQIIATDTIANSCSINWRDPYINSDYLAFLQYTSGSTSSPKGVMVSHANLVHNSAVIHHSCQHNSQSVGVIWLPPYHDMGLIGGIIQCLYGGFPVYLMSPLDFVKKPLCWLKAMSHYGGTTTAAPNFAYELCVRKISPEQSTNLDLSQWDVAIVGAEPIRVETLHNFTHAFADCGYRWETFHPCYGLAEGTLLITGSIKYQAPTIRYIDLHSLAKNQIKILPEHSPGSQNIVGVGKIWLDDQVLIVNPETRTICSTSTVGEIWIRGKSVTQGYWQKKQITEQYFQATLADAPEQYFLRTGDLGFIDQNELFITGRIKDLLILQGKNHYPQDIELTTEKSHPALRLSGSATFTVKSKGEDKLVIVSEIERHYLSKLDQNKVMTNIRSAVAREHDLQVDHIVFIKPGAMPKTSSGKIQRYACKQKYLDNHFDILQN